jgi:hypothetical protein
MKESRAMQETERTRRERDQEREREINDALARAHIQVATLSRYVHETQETVEMTSVRVASNLANLASREDSSPQLPRHVHDLQYVQTFSSPVAKSPATHPRLLPKEPVNMAPPGLKSGSLLPPLLLPLPLHDGARANFVSLVEFKLNP